MAVVPVEALFEHEEAGEAAQEPDPHGLPVAQLIYGIGQHVQERSAEQ